MDINSLDFELDEIDTINTSKKNILDVLEQYDSEVVSKDTNKKEEIIEYSQSDPRIYSHNFTENYNNLVLESVKIYPFINEDSKFNIDITNTTSETSELINLTINSINGVPINTKDYIDKNINNISSKIDSINNRIDNMNNKDSSNSIDSSSDKSIDNILNKVDEIDRESEDNNSDQKKKEDIDRLIDELLGYKSDIQNIISDNVDKSDSVSGSTESNIISIDSDSHTEDKSNIVSNSIENVDNRNINEIVDQIKDKDVAVNKNNTLESDTKIESIESKDSIDNVLKTDSRVDNLNTSLNNESTVKDTNESKVNKSIVESSKSLESETSQNQQDQSQSLNHIQTLVSDTSSIDISNIESPVSLEKSTTKDIILESKSESIDSITEGSRPVDLLDSSIEVIDIERDVNGSSN